MAGQSVLQFITVRAVDVDLALIAHRQVVAALTILGGSALLQILEMNLLQIILQDEVDLEAFAVPNRALKGHRVEGDTGWVLVQSD